MRDKNYWQRLESFKLSNIQRRVERYRIVYTWKSLNGYAPSLGLRWSPKVSGRSERTLEPIKVTGLAEGQKTLRRRTIQYEGAKLVNILPPPPFEISVENWNILKCY